MNKKQLYCALKALSRAENYLIEHNFALNDELLNFTRNAQSWLRDENLIPDLDQLEVINNKLEALVIDFDDADHLEAIVNYFLFAVLNFIYAFLQPSTTSLVTIQEEVIQFFRNIAESSYFSDHHLGASILTPEQYNEIENLPIILNEKNQQIIDLTDAEKIAN